MQVEQARFKTIGSMESICSIKGKQQSLSSSWLLPCENAGPGVIVLHIFKRCKRIFIKRSLKSKTWCESSHFVILATYLFKILSAPNDSAYKTTSLGQKVVTTGKKLKIKVIDIWENIKTFKVMGGVEAYTDLMDSPYKIILKRWNIYVDKCK